jgi:hypothetical protein
MSILQQLKAWRGRWNPKSRENGDDDLNRAFASVPTQVLDYLMETYFKPLEFIGQPSTIKLAERNGQQVMLVDILTRVDIGRHPMMYKESSEDEKPMDVRQ